LTYQIEIMTNPCPWQKKKKKVVLGKKKKKKVLAKKEILPTSLHTFCHFRKHRKYVIERLSSLFLLGSPVSHYQLTVYSKVS